MSKATWFKLEELREPGMRRVLEAMRELQEEAPDLLEETAVASRQLAKDRGDGERRR